MISVIVPIYNVEKYLDRCIQSVLYQTYDDLEIILIDDGSPDSCPQKCDEYAKKDKRIKVIHKKNAGQGLARNDGLEIATGEYVTFVDSDDFLAQNAIELMYNATEQEKHDIVCAAFYNSWSPENGGTVAYSLNEIVNTPQGIVDALADLTAAPWNDPKPALRFMGVCGCIIRTDIIKRNHLKFHSERDVMSEDLLFLYDLYPNIRSIRYIAEPLYYYCLNTTSTSHTFKETYIDCIDVMVHYMMESTLAKGNKDIQSRILKLIIYKYGILQSQILLSEIPFKEKKRISHLIYAKGIWQEIAKECPINELPHSYRYYFSIFIHKSFLKAYVRQWLYILKIKLWSV